MRKSRGRHWDRPPAPFPARPDGILDKQIAAVLNAVAVMLIPWIVNVYVVDPQSPVGLENDTPSARPAGAANGNCKNDELLT